MHDHKGDLIGGRTLDVPKGKRSVTLPGGKGDLRERIGYIALRRGDSEKIFSMRTLLEWQSTPEFPMEFGIGGLAHDDDDDDDENEDAGEDAGDVDDPDHEAGKLAVEVPVLPRGKK